MTSAGRKAWELIHEVEFQEKDLRRPNIEEEWDARQANQASRRIIYGTETNQ
jgi:hypothetical protein